MKQELFSLSETDPKATLLSYLHEEDPETKLPTRGAVIVCPGGAYEVLCPREGEPVAMSFFAAGFQAFVLHYSLGMLTDAYAPAKQAAAAIRLVREHAKDWNLDPHRVFIAGFSAGGHVAGSAGVLWDAPEVRASLGTAPRGIGRPDGMILAYPVISADHIFGHRYSLVHLCGKGDPTEEELARFSLEAHVDSTTPPTFLFHCWNDSVVSVRNSLVFAEALLEHGVPCEAHLFRHGDHGISLATPETCGDPTSTGYPDVTPWISLAITWAKHLPDGNFPGASGK